MFQSIHYQLCQMCPVSIVSVMCHQHLCNSLLQGLTADVKRLIEFDISRQRISKFQIPLLLYIVPPDQSLPPQQPNPNSNSHPGSIQPEASKRRRVIRLIRHQKEILAEISILLLTIWHGMEIDFSCQMELGAKPHLTYACTLHPSLGGRRLVAAGASDADFNEAL